MTKSVARANAWARAAAGSLGIDGLLIVILGFTLCRRASGRTVSSPAIYGGAPGVGRSECGLSRGAVRDAPDARPLVLPMTLEIAFVLVLIAGALYSFARELLPIEVNAMALLAMLMISDLVTTEEAIAGLSNKAVVAVGAMLILSHALVKTGMLEQLADLLSRRGANWTTMLLMLTVAALLSGFLNNTAVVAIFVPLAIDLCRRAEISPTRVLLPLSYVAIVGGTLTLIGTSTNLLVSSMSEAAGHGALGMFEFTRLGGIFLIIGLVYVALMARRVLPARQTPRSLASRFGLGAYLAELRVDENSILAGQTPREAAIARRYDVTVLSIYRGDEPLPSEVANTALAPGDRVLVRGASEDLIRLERELRVTLFIEVEPREEELAKEGHLISEVILAPESSLVGKTIQEADFRGTFGMQVLAIQSGGETLYQDLSQVKLQPTSSLLVFGSEERLEHLRDHEDLWVVSQLDQRRRRERWWWLVLLLYPAVIALAALGVVDIVKGAVIATIALLASRALKPAEAYHAINWSVLFLIAAFVPLGSAMVSTGADELLASLLISSASLFPPEITANAVLALLYLSTMLLTQLVSNNAAAVIVVPIAISLANTLGVDSRPFLIAVCFAASTEFMTPYGYQTNLIVFSPGKYRFTDYIRFGTPLNLTFWILGSLLIPLFWRF
ncbi:MAG: SLC13 family permease [Acidobacteria bacterium]|nr:MAG: SLC13 family permease [Acidobacteriota bacterium]